MVHVVQLMADKFDELYPEWITILFSVHSRTFVFITRPIRIFSYLTHFIVSFEAEFTLVFKKVGNKH